MMKKYCFQNEKDWDQGIPLLLFAAREATQESLGYSPFELVFGHEVRGPLKLLKEKWLGSCVEGETNLTEYVNKFRERLEATRKLASENLKEAQENMKSKYDARTQERSFSSGEKVLVFLPLQENPLQAKFSGPYTVLKKLSETNYLLSTPERRRKTRLCHINMLKKYHERDEANGPLRGHLSGHLPVLSIQQCQLENESLISEADSQEGDDKDEQKLSTEKNDPYPPIRLENSVILKDLENFLHYLDSGKRDEIKELIKQNPAIFGDKPKVTNVITHDVELTEPVRPIRQHPYRVNFEKMKRMKDELNYMIENDIIQPSCSDWSSPCVLVPKDDGSSRYCTDYRKLNAITIPDNFPLPRIEDCIDQISSAKVISKIDLLKGFWQVPLTERARKLSAFVTPDGQWEYKVLPFGMRNATCTFQRLATKITAGMTNVACYVDDIVVYTDDWASHVKILRELFERLDEANLTVNLRKCRFGASSITYLGHEVGQGKVRPIESKITPILNLPRPQSRKELRRMLGMANFYKKFCKNFSSVAAPLTALTSEKIKFQWNDACEDAFVAIKMLLTSHPVLRAPDMSRPFKLTVDASDVGIGGCLSQNFDGTDCPISFFSQKLNVHERRYSTIEKECFALVRSLNHFAVYLLATRFQIDVLTDHNPLVFIQKTKDKNARILRWSLLIQDFDICVSHIRGKDNVVADCLSRI